MPILVKCPACEAEQEIYRSFEKYDDLPWHCGKKMERVICAAWVMGDLQPYQSMITGEWITSRSRHREHLKDHGCIEVGNETQKVKPITAPPGLKETLINVAAEKLRY